MKKPLSVLLLLLLTCNMMGFSIYTLLNTNDIDNQSGKDGGIVLRVPFSVPYATDLQDIDNAENEFLYGDDYYQVVSRNVANDTIYLHCLYTKSARDRFWGLVSDFDQHLKSSDSNTKNRAEHLMKNLIKEYMRSTRRLAFFIIEWMEPETYPSVVIIPFSYIITVSSPPPNFS